MRFFIFDERIWVLEEGEINLFRMVLLDTLAKEKPTSSLITLGATKIGSLL